MILFLALIYVGILFVLIKLRIVPDSKATWLTIIPYIVILLIALIIPLQWGAPAGAARVVTYSVAIVPNVAGQVIEVPVSPNVPLKKGDVLFRIDPTPYQAALDGLNAQLKLAELRLEQSRDLVAADAGSVYELQSYEAQVDGLQAQVEAAEYNLRETTVRAPADGYVTNVALRPGARVTSLPLAPAMAFIDTSETVVGAQIHQIYTRYIEPGQEAEVTFKTIPGKVFPATVEYMIPVTAQGQVAVSGAAVQAPSMAPGPFLVRLKLDDADLQASQLPGATAEVAIYTPRTKAAHIIRRVMIRMTAILNYAVPA
ncbi:MAG: efflux RND transporter periplasmic adaptor subunit [Pseudomonadota bacterium]